jgi:probable phosphoglycerate mutase
MAGMLLIRHAESTWNAVGRWQGWADPPLSPHGEAQARQAGDRLADELPFDLVVTSDLIRTRRTAELLVDAPTLVEPGLREYDVGAWSGLTREEIGSRWPGTLERFSQDRAAAPPGGEPRDAFDSRVVAAAARTGAAAAAAGAARILVVVHGGVIRALARHAGRAEYRVGHLAGYVGAHDRAGLFPEIPVDLLDFDVTPPRYLPQS